MSSIRNYLASLVDAELVPSALIMAGVCGSLLFAINHGAALCRGEMTHERWLSGGLSYLMPYCVNIHGQFIHRGRQRLRERSAASERESGSAGG